MHLEPFEKETVITFNEADKKAIIYTRMKSIMAILKAKGIQPTKIEKDKNDKLVSKEYEVERSFILFGRKERKKVEEKGNTGNIKGHVKVPRKAKGKRAVTRSNSKQPRA